MGRACYDLPMDEKPGDQAAPTPESQPEEFTEQRRFPWIAVLFLLFLYVASTGPVFWAENRGLVPEEVRYIYFPLATLTSHAPPIRRLLNWYVRELWHGSIKFD
jgi:hypothetical protein